METKKRNILLLRGGGDAEKSSNDAYDDLQSLLSNVKVMQISVLSFVFVHLDVLTRRLNTPSDYAGIVFTSPRAVEAVNQVKASFPQESWGGEHKSVYVVGEATASKVHQLLGWKSLNGLEAGNATNLAQIIAKSEKPGSKLLFPCGNLKRNELEKGLVEAEITLNTTICYETQPKENLASIIEETDLTTLDYVVFFSPSGVKASLPLLREKWPQFGTETTKVALGPTTAECLRDHGCQCLVASKPNAQSVMTLIKETMSTSSSSD